MDTFVEEPRLRSLLDHFSVIADQREPWRIAHPLREVLLLVVCGTIASCDDFDDIAEWGEAHLSFLRGLLPYHFGIPCARWLNILMNRIDPKLFAACFMAWTRELRPDVPDVVAFDGKTSRRTHDRSAGKAALHLVSAFATAERLVLGQQAVADKSCEQEAIPELVDKLAASGTLEGAVVTIDAIACNPKSAANLITAGAATRRIPANLTAAGVDYGLTVRDNQPSLKAEVERFFADAPLASLDVHCDIDKGHGRIEERRCVVSSDIRWLQGDRRFPREYRVPKLTAIAMIEATVELKDRCHRERRYYIAS